jgi:hypothetical protein
MRRMSDRPAPHWRDYLGNERTTCSLCRAAGQVPVKVSEPGALRPEDQEAFRAHVAAVHPDARVRWDQ